MPIVHTKFQPTVPLEVSEAEAASLRAQGLLVEPDASIEIRTAVATGDFGPESTPIPVPADGSWSAVGAATNPADGIGITPAPPDLDGGSAPTDTPDTEGADTKKGSKA